jgi:L-ascorbate 6-phosphate lactonase
MNALTMNQIRSHRTPPASLTLWWLGQAGFIIKSPAGKVAALDPYLSNSCKAIGDQHGFDFDRQVPPPLPAPELVGVDLYVLTHSHQDHLDPETLAAYRANGGRGPYVAPPETVEKLQALGVPAAELSMVWPNKSVTMGDLTVRATFAIPLAGDDLTHVGYLFFVKDGPTVYFTGDTGYHELLADAVAPHKPDVLVTVINGAFRNLSPAEAAQLARRIDARVVIPCHYDLFPDNSLPPQLLRTNLKLQGIGERYHLLDHGVPFDYPA